MTKFGDSATELTLAGEGCSQLERWGKRRRSSQALLLRCRIILAYTELLSNKDVAEWLSASLAKIGKLWQLVPQVECVCPAVELRSDRR